MGEKAPSFSPSLSPFLLKACLTIVKCMSNDYARIRDWVEKKKMHLFVQEAPNGKEQNRVRGFRLF